jgi:carbon-monoxide dehydrogenase large subunit
MSRRSEQRQRNRRTGWTADRLGMSIYCEQAAHGTSVYAGWGIPMVPGHEQATARMTPDGGLEIRVGVHSHGQGMETTLAQVAHEILGIDTARSASSTATPRSRPIRPAPGAHARW